MKYNNYKEKNLKTIIYKNIFDLINIQNLPDNKLKINNFIEI